MITLVSAAKARIETLLDVAAMFDQSAKKAAAAGDYAATVANEQAALKVRGVLGAYKQEASRLYGIDLEG